ncbi:MAG TPA: MFS transporter, partial [Coxiellaceae bacterium]|nr:MFS transporter [Coxiellaceae bacterium]
MTENQTKAGSIIAMLCLISSIGRYVLDSYLPSLPAMAHYFDVSTDNVQLTISYYLLGFSLSQLIYGPLSDSFGRKRTLVIGLSIFTFASLACTFVNDDDFSSLLFFRLLAGIGAGSCGVLNRAIASDCFKGEHFSKAWSYTTTTLVITLIGAPLIGSYVQQFYNWQANFALSTIYVGLTLLVVIKFLPETHAQEKRIQWNTRIMFKNYMRILFTRSFLISTLCYTCAFSGLIAYFQ